MFKTIVDGLEYTSKKIRETPASKEEIQMISIICKFKERNVKILNDPISGIDMKIWGNSVKRFKEGKEYLRNTANTWLDSRHNIFN
jgi:hypothetical protein